MIELVLVLALMALVLTVSWRLIGYLNTIEKADATDALLSAIIQAAREARTSSAPAHAVSDSHLIPDRYRIDGALRAPSGGVTSIAVNALGTAPRLVVSIGAPMPPDLCTEISRRQVAFWHEVRIGTTIAGGIAYGTSNPIATDGQLEAACAGQPTIAFETTL